jgi:hypothetical protein
LSNCFPFFFKSESFVESDSSSPSSFTSVSHSFDDKNIASNPSSNLATFYILRLIVDSYENLWIRFLKWCDDVLLSFRSFKRALQGRFLHPSCRTDECTLCNATEGLESIFKKKGEQGMTAEQVVSLNARRTHRKINLLVRVDYNQLIFRIPEGWVLFITDHK